MSGPRVEQLAPFVRVADVERSIAFYGLFGFTVERTHEQEGWLLWCSMRSGRSRLMLGLASGPIHQHEQAILLYLYADDLEGLHDHLRAAGVAVGEPADGSPGSDRELRLEDPDGYALLVAQDG
ncbi:MAG: VOC family protein [Thermoleophilaceae bacterium]